MARADFHSRLVGWLKVVLPLAALAILSTLFLLADLIDPTAAIPYAEVDVEDLARDPRWGRTEETYGEDPHLVSQMGAAAMVAVPTTRRIGGWFAAATFVGVFPANVWAALQGGMQGLDAPFDSAAVAWARLPLQIPMIWWASKVARRAD